MSDILENVQICAAGVYSKIKLWCFCIFQLIYLCGTPWYSFWNGMYVKPFITLDRGQLRDNPNKIWHLSKGTFYIENLDYVILTELKIIMNEFLEEIFILSILPKVSPTLKKIF